MRRGAQEVFEVRGYIEHESDKAILLRMPDDEKIWFPLSQVNEIHRSKDLDPDRLVVSAWIAKQKGLI